MHWSVWWGGKLRGDINLFLMTLGGFDSTSEIVSNSVIHEMSKFWPILIENLFEFLTLFASKRRNKANSSRGFELGSILDSFRNLTVFRNEFLKEYLVNWPCKGWHCALKVLKNSNPLHQIIHVPYKSINFKRNTFSNPIPHLRKTVKFPEKSSQFSSQSNK